MASPHVMSNISVMTENSVQYAACILNVVLSGEIEILSTHCIISVGYMGCHYWHHIYGNSASHLHNVT